MKTVPAQLKTWFVIHFIADMLFAIPLMIAPAWTLGWFELSVADGGVTARLVAAALIGIGGVSLLTKNKGIESYQTMLSLKLLWSFSAVVGLMWSIAQGASMITWFIVIIFALFFLLWLFYKRKLAN